MRSVSLRLGTLNTTLGRMRAAAERIGARRPLDQRPVLRRRRGVDVDLGRREVGVTEPLLQLTSGIPAAARRVAKVWRRPWSFIFFLRAARVRVRLKRRWTSERCCGRPVAGFGKTRSGSA